MADQRFDDQLDRLWDRVMLGESAPPGSDPDLVNTLLWLRDRGRVPTPDAAFVARVRDELVTTDTPRPALPAPAHPRANGRAVVRPWGLWRPVRAAVAGRPRTWLLPAATAMVVLVVVGLGLLTFILGRAPIAFITGGPTPEATMTEAPVGIDVGTLARITVPAEMIPTGEVVSSGFALFTVPPNTRSTWEAATASCCPGVRFEYVLQGTYIVRPAGPVQMLRAGGAADVAAAGTEIVLQAGDAVLFPSELAFEAENPGSTAVELISEVITTGDPPGIGPVPPGWSRNALDLSEVSVPTDQTFLLRLQRIVLTPEARLPSSSAIVQAMLSPETATVSETREGAIRNLGADPVTIYLLTLHEAGGSD